MNANTYTRNTSHKILWSMINPSLCSTNRQLGAGRGLQALFAHGGKTINRDIHRFWGEDFFRGMSLFFVETSNPFP